MNTNRSKELDEENERLVFAHFSNNSLTRNCLPLEHTVYLLVMAKVELTKFMRLFCDSAHVSSVGSFTERRARRAALERFLARTGIHSCGFAGLDPGHD